jgi:hypothetical protein
MTPRAHAAKAAEIQKLHDCYNSWRLVREGHYPTIPAGTLCTIAKSRGAKIPKKHMRALGLIGERRASLPSEKRVSRKIAKMANATREKVLRTK